jgi:hypothetical protein
MISEDLTNLAEIAKQMEALLPTGSPTYRLMYHDLEDEISKALEKITDKLVKKFNIPMEHPNDPSD